MRRMPKERRLATLLGTGAPLDDPVRAVARMLAAFHATARRDAEITVEGGRDALRARWTDSFEELRRFRGTVLDEALVAELQRRASRFLDGREPLLAARQLSGRIVDGHGDLLTEDIFILDDGPGCWAVWSSMTGCATSTGSMTLLSSPWTWSTGDEHQREPTAAAPQAVSGLVGTY